jgi:opacity protein-like surface antigen
MAELCTALKLQRFTVRRGLRGLAAVVSVLVSLMAVSPTASAQNYFGEGRLRFGLFSQFQAQPISERVPAKDSDNMGGFGIGASLGYDWNLYKNWIVGVEADGTAVDGGGSLGIGSYNSDYFATFRGRVGYQYNPRLLLYGTAGVALNGVHYRGPPATASTADVFKVSTTLPGFVGGIGAEYEWMGMHIFGEYLVAGFQDWSFAGGAVGTTGGQHSFDTSAHMFRFGVKFLYGHDHMYEDDRRPRRRY